MGLSKNIEISQESWWKHILRIQWLRLPTHFDLFTPSHCILFLFRLVEEFMLLANMAVAHKTYKTFPQKALLRRHPPPKSKMMEDLVSGQTIGFLFMYPEACSEQWLSMSSFLCYIYTYGKYLQVTPLLSRHLYRSRLNFFRNTGTLFELLHFL